MEMQAEEKPATRSESVLSVYVSSVPIETDIKKKKKIRVLKYLQKTSSQSFTSSADFPKLELETTPSNR